LPHIQDELPTIMRLLRKPAGDDPRFASLEAIEANRDPYKLSSAHLRDAHRDCGDSTDNVRVLWVANMSGLLSRLGRGQKHQLAAVHLAPAAHIRISKLHKIDWSFEFVVPPVRLDLRLLGVDLYKRTGPQHWVKRAVFDPDISVKGIPLVHVLE
jgi:hypothetical protein